MERRHDGIQRVRAAAAGQGSRSRHRVAVLAPLLAVVAAVVVLAISWSGVARPPVRDPIRIGINPWPGYEFAMLASELGYYEDEGVGVHFVELTSLGDARRAFERGQLDGFFGTLVEVMLTEQDDTRALEVVIAADYSDGADALMAQPGIGSLADLRGATIGAEPGTLTEVLLSLALERAGLGPDDVTVRWMPAIEMPRAFGKGRIDAAVCYPPVSVLIAEQGGRTVFDSSMIPGVILDVLAIDAETARANPEAMEAIRRAFFRAQRHAERHPDEAYAIMAARQGIGRDDFEGALTNGITLLREADQPAFLREGGIIADVRASLEGGLTFPETAGRPDPDGRVADAPVDGDRP